LYYIKQNFNFINNARLHGKGILYANKWGEQMGRTNGANKWGEQMGRTNGANIRKMNQNKVKFQRK
jgi:hypothetical protein